MGGNCTRAWIARGVVHQGPSMLQFTMFILIKHHCHTFEREYFFSHFFFKIQILWMMREVMRKMHHLLSTVCQVVLHIFTIHEKNLKDRITPILEMSEIQRISINSSKFPSQLKGRISTQISNPKNVFLFVCFLFLITEPHCSLLESVLLTQRNIQLFFNSNKEFKKSDDAK